MIEQPDIRPVKESGKLYRLQSDYTYRGITVPAGFQYDGASVPRLVWTLMGFLPDGIHRAAALMHDWLIECKGRIETDSGVYLHLTRHDADNIFLSMMLKCGVKSVRAHAAYIAVRIFAQLKRKWND